MDKLAYIKSNELLQMMVPTMSADCLVTPAQIVGSPIQLLTERTVAHFRNIS